MFSLDTSALLREARLGRQVPVVCVSFFGHDFRLIAGQLHCSRCCVVRAIRRPRRLCTSWNGHVWRTRANTTWCACCGRAPL